VHGGSAEVGEPESESVRAVLANLMLPPIHIPPLFTKMLRFIILMLSMSKAPMVDLNSTAARLPMRYANIYD